MSGGDPSPSPSSPAEAERESLVRFCSGYLGNRDEAEDAAQEVLGRAIALEGQIADRPTWLRRTARNHCLNLLRTRRRRRDGERLPTDPPFARSLAGPLTRMAGAERERAVRDAVAALTDEQREALWLRYGENLPRAEIAAILDVEESVVKSRLHEALEKLRP
jgi:RNA polymerase sigma-70 factor (ECF subfamily)